MEVTRTQAFFIRFFAVMIGTLAWGIIGAIVMLIIFNMNYVVKINE